MNFSEIVDLIKAQDDQPVNPFLQKIDMSFVNLESGVDGINYYRMLDGITPEISAQLYDDLLPNNFNEEEREEKTDFHAFF